jgi:hypothetical protein
MPIHRLALPLLPLLLLALPAHAQEPAAPPPRKEIRAVRISAAPPTVDGRLDDAVWETAPVLSDFVQKQPVEGAPPTERTEVRFLYDDHALYVGLRMHKDDAASIQAPLGRRDDGGQAEHVWISLDTWLDRRTAYSFGVTAAGTRMDWYHPTDDETDIDASFDPVWEARVARDSLGWTAEMRIPFSQLRFRADATSPWGLNVDRWNPATREDVFWIPIPSQEQGWASRMGHLVGIEGVAPARRLELLPYVAASGRFTADPGTGNPFDDGSSGRARIGGDMKMGLGPSLTLEATVNPDFGQVEADPAEVNLSAFETFFPERRPFFIEGSQLLQGGGPTYFYSRRIGATPRGAAAGDHVDYPRTSTILGAGKLTGRVSATTAIGALAAVTRAEDARVFDAATGAIGRVRVAPTTGYGVVRAERQFGPDASTIGVMATAVRRDVTAGDPLAELLHREAYTGGADWNLRMRQGEYSLSGWAGWSWVAGDSSAILGTQRGSARYFQRPDATHVRVDPSRTSLGGFGASLQAARNSGRHWLWSLYGSAYSPGFELNDAGAMGQTDYAYGSANLRYRETSPGTRLRNYDLGVGVEGQTNFEGVRTFAAIRTDLRFTWLNFWRTTVIGWVDLPAQSRTMTRGGPLMGTPRSWFALVGVGNPTSSRFRIALQGDVSADELGYRMARGFVSASVIPGPRWRMSVMPNYRIERGGRQYVAARPGGSDATFGTRYVFAEIDRNTLSMQFRLNYLFTPDLSLEMYAEPFVASGRHHHFGELPAAGATRLRRYGTDGTAIRQEGERGPYTVTDGEAEFTLPYRDFNVRSFRSNAVLRWEWRPGSTLFLVWQQDRYGLERSGAPLGFADLPDVFAARGDNTLALKATYWIPVR